MTPSQAARYIARVLETPESVEFIEDQINAVVAAANQENARLREALGYYANGDYSTCEAIGEYHSPMDTDAGAVARKAILDT